jgi:uncharacterized membrane protein
MMSLLAQYHSAFTHLPIAAAILAAVCAITCLFTAKREVATSWALLSIIAFATATPLLVTGMAAAKGRFNSEGKPYIEQGILVSNTPADARLFLHQSLGIAGFLLSSALALLGIARLRGRVPNRLMIVLLALAIALCWGIGGHLGGEELWGPDTFPGYSQG